MAKGNPLLVFRIGWMDYYAGPGEILGGGSYISKHGAGGEMWNFENKDGYYLGYVRTGRGAGLNLSKIDPSRKWQTDDEMPGVDIAFIATRPNPEKGQVLVGWYKNATVFHKHHRKTDGREKYGQYVCMVSAENAELVPVGARPTVIEGNNPLHNNVWYGDAANKSRLIKIKKELIRLMGESSLTRNKEWQKKIAEKNRAIEKAAVKTVITHYEKIGYTVESVERDNKGWDLEASPENGDQILRLEVKGHQHDRVQFQLTPNEYTQMKKMADGYRVCAVINALTKPRLMVFRPVKCQKDWHMIEENGRHPEIRLEEIVSAKAAPI